MDNKIAKILLASHFKIKKEHKAIKRILSELEWVLKSPITLAI